MNQTTETVSGASEDPKGRLYRKILNWMEEYNDTMGQQSEFCMDTLASGADGLVIGAASQEALDAIKAELGKNFAEDTDFQAVTLKYEIGEGPFEPKPIPID